MKILKPEIIVIDIIILGIIDIFLLICGSSISIYRLMPYNILDIIYYYIIVECILKIIFTIILIIKYEFIPKFYFKNIPQIIFSLLFILIFIFIFLDEGNRNTYLTVHGIPLLLIGISTLIFQLYYINKCDNKYLKIISTFLMPIIFLIFIFCWLGFTIDV
jgi:hypothetical protein